MSDKKLPPPEKKVIQRAGVEIVVNPIEPHHNPRCVGARHHGGQACDSRSVLHLQGNNGLEAVSCGCPKCTEFAIVHVANGMAPSKSAE